MREIDGEDIIFFPTSMHDGRISEEPESKRNIEIEK